MFKLNNRYKILWFMIVFNILPFLQLFFNIEAIRKTIDIMNSIVFPKYSPTYTEAPKFVNLWYQIFQFNYFIFFIYLIFVVFSFYILVIRQDKKWVKILSILILEMLLVIILSFHEQYILPLIMLYNFSISTMILLSHLYQKKPIKWILTIFIFINVIGLITNYFFRYYSLEHNDILVLFNQERSLYDLNYISSISKFVLFDSLTTIYYTNMLLIFIYLIYKMIIKMHSKLVNKEENKFLITFEIRFFMILFTIIFTIQVLFYSYDQLTTKNVERNIDSINACYSSYLNLGLGENYIGKNNLYFDRCFNTTQGVFTVYKEIEKDSNNNYFDLIQAVKFKRIILFNENNEEIMSFGITDQDINIYVTTIEEYNLGYNNLIFVEKDVYKDDKLFPDYYFYNLNGELVLKLPYGFPDRNYTKTDLLDSDSLKLLFKDNKIIYRPINDGKFNDFYIYYLDGTKESLGE